MTEHHREQTLGMAELWDALAREAENATKHKKAVAEGHVRPKHARNQIDSTEKAEQLPALSTPSGFQKPGALCRRSWAEIPRRCVEPYLLPLRDFLPHSKPVARISAVLVLTASWARGIDISPIGEQGH
jgi:hypothetical protein